MGNGDKFFSVDDGWYSSGCDTLVRFFSMDKHHPEVEDCAGTLGTYIPTHSNHPIEARFNL